MGPIVWFLFVYVLGGLTFIPLLLGLILLHASRTFPVWDDKANPPTDDPAEIKQFNDDKLVLKTITDDLADKFLRKHESDVAAGYFAVCRDYVPGGVNGKPPDKLSPAGEVVATESPSVYQSMYRSIFDRSQKPTIEPNKDGPGKAVKKANNVFFVVLRHGHLMLYDDIQQLEVRYVISLEYHDVDVYSGGDSIPDGELWIKRNAIRLSRKAFPVVDRTKSLPFFLFSENNSEKEDFYFALLKNQETRGEHSPPEAQHFDVKDIVTLVQKLHSSEEHLQTRWLNALMGRLFLAIYKTPQLEDQIRKKLTKKISRVKKPNFITRLALQKISPGDGGPFLTNPRLKDLSVNGDCTVEADINYSGNFTIEIAATARIELGTRFKAREVDLILAVTCTNLEGHGLVRFKPPPSNRLWYTFEKMPKIDMTIKPIVSSRQITYSIIIKAIESRIREVIAETLVLPFWDDAPFLDTSKEQYRGGIWKTDPIAAKSTEIEEEDQEVEAEAGGEGTRLPSEVTAMKDERTMSTVSMPVFSASKHDLKARTGKRSAATSTEAFTVAASSPVEKASTPEAPRVMRSSSFAVAADPKVTMNHVDADSDRRDSDVTHKRDAASAMLKDLSGRSSTTSPTESLAGSSPTESTLGPAKKERASSITSKASSESLPKSHAQQSSTASSVLLTTGRGSIPSTPTSGSFESKPPSINDDKKRNSTFAYAARSLTGSDRKQALAQINAATAAAQKWGWGVLNRNKQHREGQPEASPDPKPDVPMGRGRPLPPPGTPLPPPERSNSKATLGGTYTAPKRKALPPPLLPKRPDIGGQGNESLRSSPRPPLPERRKRQSSMQDAGEQADEVLVVEAPTEESAPTSPAAAEHYDELFRHHETVEFPEQQAELLEPRLPREQYP